MSGTGRSPRRCRGGDPGSLFLFRGVGGNITRTPRVSITALLRGPCLVLCPPLSSDLLSCGRLALFRLVLGRDDDVTESPIEFPLQLGEVFPRERDQAALLQSGLTPLYGNEVI